MAKKIDPAFVSAPYYGGSSYDPIQAVKEIKATNNQSGLARQKKLQEDTEKGLKELTMDIKGWSDQQGSDEITKELEETQAKYVELGTQGMNLYRPNSMAERKVAKAFRTKMNDLKQKHAVWQEEKMIAEAAEKFYRDQEQLPQEEQTADFEAGIKAMEDWKSTEGGILERRKKMKGLIVTKARPEDIGAYFDKQIGIALPGLDANQDNVSTDPTTGQTTIKGWAGMDATRLEAGIKKVVNGIKNAPDNIQNAINNAYEKAKGETVLSKDEWVRENFVPLYPEKTTTSIRGGSGGGGIELNFLGKKTTMKPGTLQTNPRTYGSGDEGRTYTSYYEFDTDDVFTIPLGKSGASTWVTNAWLPAEGGGDVEGKLLFYDSNRDEFVFRTTQASIFPFSTNNQTVAVPRANLGDQVDELPIEVDGVTKKLKDVYGSGPEVKMIGGVDYRDNTLSKGKSKTIGDKSYLEPYIPGKKK